MNDTDNSATGRQTLAERYGTQRSAWWLRSVVVAVAAVLLGWLVWAAWVQSTPDVRGALRSYDVVSEHEVRVKVEVVRAGTAAVTCTVSAQAEDHTVVGEQVVTFAAGDSGAVGLETSITTDRRATSATLTDCT